MAGTTTAAELRTRLVSHLKRAGYLRTEAVENAFLGVPRHLFVPSGVSPEEAYRDEVISLVPGLATLSQPSVVALMLEELKAGPGMKVLEIGTASGYNAALLSEVVGEPGLVYTIEIDPHLAQQAKENLAAAGYGDVHAKAGDGTLGWPEGAPYARIIVTAEATDLSQCLVDQLDREGALLTPFAVQGLPALLLRLRRQERTVTGEFVGMPVAFVPLRGKYGVASHPRETGARRAREAIWALENEAWEEGLALSLDRRLALDLLAAALAEDETVPPDRVASKARERYEAAGEPELSDLGVSVLAVKDCPAGRLGFRRRDFAFCLDLPTERNTGGRGESP